MGRVRRDKDLENLLVNELDFYIPNPIQFKSNWNKLLFKNTNKIHLEIGCGKGGFILEMARLNPQINFLAFDRNLTTLAWFYKKWKTCNKPKNLYCFLLDAKQITEVFNKKEIAKIYLNFSDPWPKTRHAKKRMVNSSFINDFYKVLDEKGTIEFKTDNQILYETALVNIYDSNYKTLMITNDLYAQKNLLINNVQTEYEKRWVRKGMKIKKIIYQKI